MKPSLRWVVQKVLGLTSIDICILMNVVSKSRFLTSISEERSSKRFIEHSLHFVASLLSLVIELPKERLICFTCHTTSCGGMKPTKKFLHYVKLRLNGVRRERD